KANLHLLSPDLEDPALLQRREFRTVIHSCPCARLSCRPLWRRCCELWGKVGAMRNAGVRFFGRAVLAWVLLKTSAIALATQSVTLSWNAVPEVLGYVVHYGTAS